jgi:predicted DNA-binding ribbon-helix-helix protein
MAPPKYPNRRGFSSLTLRNVIVSGRRTSVRLEPAMWDALQDIARRRRRAIHDLVTEIERNRSTSSLTAAIRVYIVDYYRGFASNDFEHGIGHAAE